MKLSKKIFRSKKRVRLLTWIALWLLLLLVPILLVGLLRPKTTDAAWFNEGWKYRVKINIASNTGADTNAYVTTPAFDASDTNKFQSDCGDLRFTKESGELLPYFVNDCDASSTVRVLWNTLPAGESNYYMYYGNPSAPNGFSLTDFTDAAGSLGSLTAGSETVGPGPISFWKFDEGTDNTCLGGANDACDTMPSANDLARTNALWRTSESCISDKCFEFDGSGDYLSLANDNDFDFGTGSFSISLWFRQSDIATNPDYLIARHHTTNSDGGFKVYMNADGTVTFGIDPDDTWSPSDTASSTTAYDDNTWHHLTAVKNGTTSITLYIDGKQVGTDTSITGSSLSNNDILYVGIDGDGSSNSWDGLIDSVKIYGYARSAAEARSEAVPNAAPRGAAVVLGNPGTEFLTDGLVGYWKMDETSWSPIDCATDVAMDSSGNGNNGDACPSSTGPAGGAAGKFNYAGDFDGTNDRLDMGDPASGVLDFGTGDFSISLWFKPDTTDFATRMVSKGAFNNAGYFFGIEDSVGNLLQGLIGNSGAVSADYINPITTAAFLDTTHWYHAVFVVDRGNAARIYVDGVLQTIDKGTGTCGTDMVTYLDISSCTVGNASTTSDFTIGCESDGTTQCFNGKLDDVRVYNRALSDIEARGITDFAPGPVAYWKFDEGSGITAYDSSGNTNTGTIITPGAGAYSIGKYGGAYTFDGITTQINASSGTTLDNLPATGLTLEAWIYPTSQGESSAGVIMAKNLETTPLNGWLFQHAGTNALTFTIDGSTDLVRTTSNSVLTMNAWNHVAVSWDGVITTAASVHIYINGVEPSYATTTNGAARVDDASETFYIGNDTTQARTFDGKIDEGRVYNYARTQAQVLEDMNASSDDSPPSPPLIHWNFDEGQGTTANNKGTAGSTSNGALTSFPAASTSTSGWTTSGKVNKAIVFDGTDDNVVITNANDSAVDFNGSEAFTMTAWVNSTAVPASTTEQDFIIGKWDQNSGLRAYRIVLENDDTDTTGNFRAEVFDDVGATQSVSAESATDSVSANTWYHVAMTFNGCTSSCDGTVKIYVNGLDVSIAASTGSFAGIDDVAVDFTVGDYDATDSNAARTPFTGYIDEVKVYSGVLTAENIRADMNAGAIRVGYSQSSANESSQVADGIGTAPIGHWTLDENTGTTAKDSSGNEKTGTLNNFPTSAWIPGKNGSALLFDDASTYISVPSPGLPTGDFTYQAWVYLNTGSDETIMAAGGTNELFFRITGSNAIELDLNNTTAFEGNASVPLNRWVHIAVTRSGSALVGYINGVPDPAPVTNTSSQTPSFGTCYLLIGTDADSATSNCTTTLGNYMNGKIDDAKIYNYARTQAQVDYDYNRGRPIGWWKFDECQGSTVYDSSGIGNNGTIDLGGVDVTTIGTCTTASSMRGDGASGKLNYSLDFDGSDDTVSMGDVSLFDFEDGQDFSITGWFNLETTTNDVTMVAKTTSPSSGPGYIVYIDGDNDDKLKFNTHDGTQFYFVSSTSTFNASGWHHFAAIWDDDSETNTTIYIDGKPDNPSKAGLFSSVNSLASTNVLAIGSHSDGGDFMMGDIDDIRIYNYVLSAAQVKKIYSNDAAVFFGPSEGSP